VRQKTSLKPLTLLKLTIDGFFQFSEALNNRLLYDPDCEIFIIILQSSDSSAGGKMGKRKKRSRTKKPQSKPISQKPKLQSLSQKPKNQSLSLEINTIVQFSHQRELHLIAPGRLIFFSTATGDAWILDPDEGRAKCLCLDGEKQPFTINETSAGHSIDWDSEYRIKGSLFTVLEYSGSVRTILGYPTLQIEAAIRQGGV
jgi:hypothetical protein